MKPFSKAAILLLLIFFVASCITVRFENPQPADGKRLNKFPEYLVGVYSNEESDTLHIGKNSFKFKDDTVNISGKVSADEFVLNEFEGYHILNIQTDNIWDVYLVKRTNGSINVYTFQFDSDKIEDLLEKLNKITPVKQVKGDDDELDYLLINPTSAQFREIIDAGIISSSIEFTLLNGEEE